MPESVADAQSAAESGPDEPAGSPAPSRLPNFRILLLGFIAPTFIVSAASLALLLQRQESLPEIGRAHV